MTPITVTTPFSATLGVAAALVLTAFEDSVVYFHSPTDIATKQDLRKDRLLRIGGLVKQGSWQKAADGLTHLKIKLSGDDLAWDIDRVVSVESVAAETQAKRGVEDWNYSKWDNCEPNNCCC